MPEAKTRTILTLAGLEKRFDDFTALHGVDLEVDEGEFLTIVGPSGSGKTTLIRLLVGLEAPSSGAIWLRGRRIDTLPPDKRPTCMVFQSLALFPHRSVGENIEFPLKIRGMPKAKRRARAMELLALLRLPESYHGKRIQHCSGGEKQRVALARALAFDPEILFFDEPLSALDYRLRKTLEKELKDLHARTGKTFLYITHSLEEAMVMSDRIAIMRAGRFEQIATPDEIYQRPGSRFVAEFMGEVNLFDVAVKGMDLQCRHLSIRPGAALSSGFTDSGTLVVRPEVLRFLEPGQTAEVEMPGQLVTEYALGSRCQYSVELPAGRQVTVEVLRETRPSAMPGELVRLGCELSGCHVIPDA
jgi:spermidine/putrescine transport system ATP-binding protein